MKKKLSITMDSKINEELDSYAKDNQKVKSQVIEIAVVQYLEKENKKMNQVEEYMKKFVADMKPGYLEKEKAYIADTKPEEYLKKFVDDMGKDEK